MTTSRRFPDKTMKSANTNRYTMPACQPLAPSAQRNPTASCIHTPTDGRSALQISLTFKTSPPPVCFFTANTDYRAERKHSDPPAVTRFFWAPRASTKHAIGRPRTLSVARLGHFINCRDFLSFIVTPRKKKTSNNLLPCALQVW